jgi:hypothetical protein
MAWKRFCILLAALGTLALGWAAFAPRGKPPDRSGDATRIRPGEPDIPGGGSERIEICDVERGAPASDPETTGPLPPSGMAGQSAIQVVPK